MDGLAFFLHHPTIWGHQMRGQSFLIGVAPSCHAEVGGGTFLRGGVSPWDWTLDVVLTIWVLMRSNLMWRSLPLLGCTYPGLELSWQLCMFPW
jgi:hypothetical protein